MSDEDLSTWLEFDLQHPQDHEIDQYRLSQVEEAYAVLEDRYIAKNPKSRKVYISATESLPGGNTRTVLFYEPFPLSVQKAHGSTIHTVDGHSYVDLLGEYTAGLYGHSNPEILSAISEALQNGLNFGSQHENEAALAKLVKERFASIDLLRFTNSGTEANLMAISAAKVFNKKRKVIVFENAYHGGCFLFKGGGNPLNAPFEYLVARYNDVSSVDTLIHTHGNDVAVIIVEPMLGSGGAIPASVEFLKHLRSEATRIGAVLIFDEVMTSRLYSGRGVQSEIGVIPDMTTLGKYIGGGMSFGAFGGREDIMSQFDPRHGSLAHAGTFNNNTLTMAAGRAGLQKVFTQDVARGLQKRGDLLRQRLNEAAKGTLLKVTGCGSIMNFHFSKLELRDIGTTFEGRAMDSKAFLDLLHLEMLEAGYYIARRGFIALSLAVSDVELAGFVDSIARFVQKYRDLLSLE